MEACAVALHPCPARPCGEGAAGKQASRPAWGLISEIVSFSSVVSNAQQPRSFGFIVAGWYRCCAVLCCAVHDHHPVVPDDFTTVALMEFGSVPLYCLLLSGSFIYHWDMLADCFVSYYYDLCVVVLSPDHSPTPSCWALGLCVFS